MTGETDVPRISGTITNTQATAIIRRWAALPFCLMALLPLSLGAEAPPPNAGKRIDALRIEGAAPRIDGILDEELWRLARPVSDFLQKEPNEGAPPNDKTELLFAYDADALYVGARLHFRHPDSILATVSRRDNAGNSQRIIISMDTYNDKRTAYSFGVTATGVRFDYYHADDQEFSRDYSFNPVWTARTQMNDSGWTAEMRIPFSQLRFSADEHQHWGININRWIPSRFEDLYWVTIPKNSTGWASRFGSLEGIRGIEPSSRVELLPYLAGNFTRRAQASAFDDDSEFDFRGGADLKMGLGPNLTLDAAFNPDFGQVEADPAEVNLSAFETFFSERRPFFTEGSQLLSGTGPSYYYSRRIGAAPRPGPLQRSIPDSIPSAIQAPDNTQILGAAKLTGRMQSGFSLGLLTAVTAEERAAILNIDDRSRTNPVAEAPAVYSVARAQQEIGADASTLGLMLTSVQRDLDDGSLLAGFFNRQAYSGGLDWNLRFAGGEYLIRGHAGFSHIRGSTSAMIRAQESSARFFQRPDAGHVSVDSNASSLSGYTAALRLQRSGGEHWLGSASIWMESPEFEINDLGQLASSDDINANANIQYRETQPGSWFHSYSLNLSSSNGWNFDGDHVVAEYEIDADVTFKNYYGASIELRRRPRRLSDGLTRGGPLMGLGAAWDAELSLNGNFASNTNWNGGLRYIWDELDGSDIDLWASYLLRSGASWEFSIDPSFSVETNTRQYITSIDDGPASTFGRRYVFGRIDRTTIAAQFRFNYSFTPDLSLELYAEPFVASGEYSNIGELRAAGSRDLKVYGRDGSKLVRRDDDVVYVEEDDGASSFPYPAPENFLVQSFRSNLVLRWEWLPGSTLFFVWQQNAFADQEALRAARLKDFFDAVGSEADSFLALKIAYWFPAF